VFPLKGFPSTVKVFEKNGINSKELELKDQILNSPR
jgi:hypothetical protein